MDPTTRCDRCLVILDGKVYKVRSFDLKSDGWLSTLCGYNHAQCDGTVVLSQMFGIYRYMGWIAGLKKNHSRVLARLYTARGRGKAHD